MLSTNIVLVVQKCSYFMKTGENRCIFHQGSIYIRAADDEREARHRERTERKRERKRERKKGLKGKENFTTYLSSYIASFSSISFITRKVHC